MSYLPKPEIIEKLRPYKHSVLEASAGTGKTYALEHIVLDILIEEKIGTRRVGLEDILILTFTERATQDLKARIRTLIEKCLKQAPGKTALQRKGFWNVDKYTRLHLQEQLEHFSSASIHTIHAFCRKILSENAFLLGRAISEKIDNTNDIFTRAFKRALREDFACDPLLKSFLEAWMEKPNAQLSKLQGHLEKVCRYDDPLRPDFNLKNLTQTLDELVSHPEAFDEFISNQRRFVKENAQNIRDSVNRYSVHRSVATYLLEADAHLGAMRGGAKKNNAASLSDFEILSSSPVRQLFLETIPLETAILHLFSVSIRNYIKEEKQKGVFDFHDMLDSVHTALHGKNSAPLLTFLRNKYRFGLIDEFQDTDSKQWEIFKRIFIDSGHTNPLLLIGDPKQSIYAFRGADVQTYLSAQETIAEKSRKPPVPLVTNFRSTDTMIRAYNAILRQEADPPFFRGEIDYKYPVACGNINFRATRNQNPVIPIELIQPTSDSTLDAYALKRILARWICSQINELVEEPIHVERSDESKKVNASDIFILTYSNEEARFIGGELKKQGISHSFYKQTGLFQSQEAEHLLRILKAIAEPYDQRHRLPAWATPFFGVAWQDLRFYENIGEDHPFMVRLLGWHRRIEYGDFEAVFNDIIESSGITRRELFDNESNRRLTNYKHIIELLLEEATRNHLTLAELVVRLDGFIRLKMMSKNDDRNIQRQDSNKNAVQIMTIHSSKGLEADVVFIFGGFSHGGSSTNVRFVHQKGKRLQYFGPARSSKAKRVLDKQDRGEAERLLYVAMTRARVKLYLPYLIKPNGRTLYKNLKGRYKILNARLVDMEQQSDLHEDLFTISQAPESEWLRASKPAAVMTDLTAIESINTPDPMDLSLFRPSPLIVTSYSRMKAGQYEAAVFKGENATVLALENDLPSGISTGLFLHELLELVEIETFTGRSKAEWKEEQSVQTLFQKTMQQFHIAETHKDRSMDLVWGALNTSFQLPDGSSMPSLTHASRERREVEFYVPIPEESHPQKGLPEGQSFDMPLEINTGYFKGFVDLIFEYEGKIYFADWKSDLLESFDKDTISDHVEKNYQTQAKLYSFALTKMFSIKNAADYESRIGGFLYCFLRGLGPEKHHGFFVGKVPYDILCQYETELMTRSYQ